MNDKEKKNTQIYSLDHQEKEKHIGHLKTQEIPIETSNPYFQPAHPESSSNRRTIKAIVNVQSRPIALLYAKGHISKTQYRAAERFYFYWRQSQADLHTSLDYSREKISCNQDYTFPIERQIEASDQLKTVKIQLGILGYSLLEQVIGHGQGIKELSSSKRKQNSLADHLRDCLDLLAFHWGYANHKHSE
ncbi:hypothetical protein [Bartonella rattimassiliensis]|uniref:Uncharacterized protein n=1 Tax=Bartonella rattimassiliensis 15908 TaxID=1094556 RepID=J0ZI29_9HYPH|nr:hypothetical protein [Bartonella rattimassiliensis]EJF87853.1 hypothetical protein MCY_00056 [Bartonella rattimassiliensis 15908]